ncbi:MAG: hypothetical protein ACYDCK_06185 [Thermoplasmatota archaeon]
MRDALKARAGSAAFVAKEIGYELRCADPTAFDVGYARALGAGAIDFLASGSGNASGRGHAMVALVGDRLTPISLDSVRDPATGRVRTRTVDPASEAWRLQRSLEARITPRDLVGGPLAKLAAAAGLEPAACAAHFAPVARESLS